MTILQNITNYYKHHGVNPWDIMYIKREDGKTALHLMDGRVLTSFTPAKNFMETLKDYDFLNINKGTFVSKSQIDRIEDGIYYMLDGTALPGRKRSPGAHRRLNKTLHIPTDPKSAEWAADLRLRYAGLDNMPAAFCIIELVWHPDGSGVDFIYRYANHEMAREADRTIEQMIGRSFFDIFPKADKKWLVTYSDVAVNGTVRYIRDYSYRSKREMYVQCFRPMDGYCACLLTPTDGNMLPAPTAEQKILDTPGEKLWDFSSGNEIGS